ncbi:NAD-specific glutamate dehydrogenase [Rubrobacter radiotolerans]|uniref:NAD-glutamate dehydrogenase n=1 Tax=Rubrobacter radiotolerans TaxID=42256 RepID=A0A023X048_RUBRA|nr:NAD-glutamate dehydrogenase [Rubrobacter radiotolerans]AHY45708.1 NAD-specific glutamate dehydrogenase [Rubrobacter radiotolerans]MDX5893124.1 NAD-glutamate dehydrogenase [Rubrobacter radiotolerans]SMC03100.1 glutamate dehydrogenase [Rubrobacter radiotolerans DSM 5868]
MMTKGEVLERVIERVEEHVDPEQAATVEEFIRQYYAWVPEDELRELDPVDVYGAAVSHYNFLRQRAPGESKVRVYNPHHEPHGWQSTHTVVELVTDDKPFLVDSVSMELNRLGHGLHRIFHPIIRVRRDGEGNLTDLLAPDEEPEDPEDVLRESAIHVEVDRRTEPEVLEELRRSLELVLSEVRAAVEDWGAMTERVAEIVSELRASPPPSVEPGEVEETAAFLEWLVDEHFVFTGYREYDLKKDEETDEDALIAVPDSGLGILRRPEGAGGVSGSFANLPPAVRRLAREPNLLNLTKANSESRVHRPAHLDYVGVKKFDGEGNVVGERRFLGLYTMKTYSADPLGIPLIRRKLRSILKRAGFPKNSHYEKSLLEVFGSYPRDQLLQTPEDELAGITLGILQLQEKQSVRLFARRDTFGRFVSCLVFVPRDRYDTNARVRIRKLLVERFNAHSVDFSVRLSESVLARLLFVVYARPEDTESYNLEELERAIFEATRTWQDDLYEALIEGFGEERGTTLFYRYRDAFPAGYKEEFLARRAYPDIERLEELREPGDLGMSLYRQLEEPEDHFRFKLFRKERIVSLSEVLPLLENMGVTVVDEIGPFDVRPVGTSGDSPGERFWIHDFGLRAEKPLDTGEVRTIFQETFRRVWDGKVENDGFNRLVLRAGLDWREITALRAVCKYLRQTNLTFSQSYMEATLARNPHLARLLVRLFKSRFDPRRQGHDNGRAGAATESLVGQIREALDDVASLDEDRIIQSFLNVILAMRRTNFYRADSGGNPLPYLSFKLEPQELPELPEPRPKFEIFVYSPRTEGVHLRGGEVARGGIRWSDRREDFRTEVLGLMKAQTVKNAVIVPVGAKGGFVVKKPPEGASREELQQEVVHCYKTLIRGMLDLTDNLSPEGEVAPPRDVVRLDGDDPYLVVAADKGTATFSDIANGISAEYGFWLGDAFASGGSVGYDHKAMGITARGAWESVKRHFRELGHDTQKEDFTVVGIGDMSGDVFGNGMLLSRHIKLVGAFNHLHIFLDPDPDPEASFRERERLFRLPRSSWADYDASLISAGGGVFPRTAKSVDLTPEVRELLGIEAEKLPPTELLRAMLRAPVDLLWNGGIGTYVKASSETNAAVGDRANDALRVDGRDLRCRVVGEGGNLGMTQLGRIEYALGGGRVYMDAVDNSAGVDCSDHEVNIKVLLDGVVRSGDMTEKQRNKLLASMTEEVGELVLRDNYLQTQAISNEASLAHSMADLHARYIAHLEASGELDRKLEFLPSEEEISDRKQNGQGLTPPEISVLLSYTKISLYRQLLGSEALDDERLAGELVRYFPTPLRERFTDRMSEHRLRREIVATQVAGDIVNHCGTTFAFRMDEETSADFPEVARAFAAMREVFGLRSLWAEIESLDGTVPAAVQTRMHLACTKLAERATRWFIRNRRSGANGEVERFAPAAGELREELPSLMLEADREALETKVRALTEEGVPEDLARHVSLLDPLYSVLDIVDLSERTGESRRTVACIYLNVGERMNLRWLRERIEQLPRDNRWRTLARAALRDDLYNLQARMTEEITATTDAGLSPAERLDTWTEEHRRAVDRAVQVLRDVNQSGVYDLSTLPVMLRELRNLTGTMEVRA